MNVLALFRAINDRVRGWPSLIDNINGVFLSMADAGTLFPYLIVDLIGGENSETFKGTLIIEEPLVRMSIYSKSENVLEVGRLTTYLQNCFDNAILVFVEGGYTGMGCKRVGENLIRESEKIWHMITEYNIMFQR